MLQNYAVIKENLNWTSLSVRIFRDTRGRQSLFGGGGIPVEVISESMGHENEATTRIYLASLGQAVVDRANAEIIRLE